MSTRLTVEGIEGLDAALKGIPDAIRKTILADAIRPAGELVRAEIASRAPVRTGKLQKSIVFRETQIGGEPSGVIVPNRKGGAGGNHAHLVEYGTAPHDSKYYGHPAHHPGTAPNEFWNPAVDATEDAAMDLMERAVGDRIAAYWDGQGGGA